MKHTAASREAAFSWSFGRDFRISLYHCSQQFLEIFEAGRRNNNGQKRSPLDSTMRKNRPRGFALSESEKSFRSIIKSRRAIVFSGGLD
jgi:hypothetical protein